MIWREGDKVTAVEYGDDGLPVPGGRRHLGTVDGARPAVVSVTYDDPAEAGGPRDQFWGGSGWRCGEYEPRLRLEHGQP